MLLLYVAVSGTCSSSLSCFLYYRLSQAPATQDNAESLFDDFVVTESASAVEVAIAESAAVQQVRTTQR